MNQWKIVFLSLVAVSLLLVSTVPTAQPKEIAIDEILKATEEGPKELPLLSQAKLALPKGYAFIPEPHASEILKLMGNPGTTPNMQGLIFPKTSKSDVFMFESPWFMIVRYHASGYIKDDDAKKWNADDLLSSYREGTAENNKERVKLGMNEIEIIGWAEVPAYDANAHRLVWAMASKHIGSPLTDPQNVNYNTYALGREGYFSMNLVTGLNELAQHKGSASTLLAALQFSEGKRYADFNASTDKVAEYGLAALIGGVAAKKLGFFALIAAFFVKFGKIAFIALLAFGGGIWKLFSSFKKAKPVVAPIPEPSADQCEKADPIADPIPIPGADAEFPRKA